DPGAGLDQPAQHGLVPHEPGVVAGVRRRGYRGDEGVEVGGTADPAQLAALVQLGGDGHGVGRLPPAVQVDDRVVDELVRRAVEVLAAQLLDDVGDGVLRQQHPAQDALLGRQVLRRGPFVELPARGARIERTLIQLSHRQPSCSLVYRGPPTSPGPRSTSKAGLVRPRTSHARGDPATRYVQPRRPGHPRLWTNLGTDGGYGWPVRAQPVDNRVDNTRATLRNPQDAAESVVHTVWKEIGRHIGGQRLAPWGHRSLAGPRDPRARRPRARRPRRRT